MPNLRAESKKLLLLVEDNIDDERITLRALKRNNVMNEVVVACDGEEAIDFLFATGRHHERDASQIPSLIVLDLKLPGQSGIDVLKKIRSSETTRRIPVVMFSSMRDDAIIEECYDAGANSFVIKPEDLADFSETILQVSMYWLLVNHLPDRSTISS